MADKNVTFAQKTSKWTAKKIIIICAIAVVLLVGAIGMTFLDGRVSASTIPASFADMSVSTMKGQFVDMNGDGNLDFVVNADVILNPGNINFLLSTQPVTK